MSFDAPNLVSLDYELAMYPQVNLESLVEARLGIHYSKLVKRPDLTGLVIGMRNLETLHLSPASADMISRCVKHGLVLPVFKNLDLNGYTGNVSVPPNQVKTLQILGYQENDGEFLSRKQECDTSLKGHVNPFTRCSQNWTMNIG
ncbi:F-box/LRR-repeat protein [Raphanus sativus]|nr:F-box/LRR-repeat protein [Raphanus sativus]